MDVLNRKPLFRLLQSAPAGELCLRIVGTAHDGQILRLKSPKCTIGSAKGCSLRLRAAGVRPMHCLLLRGSRGTVARAWAPNIRLNGINFTDAPLVAGDRLKIGPIELEVVADSADVHPDSQSHAGQQVTTSTRLPNPPEQVPVLRGRIRNLIATARGLHAEVERLRHVAESQADDSSEREALLARSEPSPSLALDKSEAL